MLVGLSSRAAKGTKPTAQNGSPKLRLMALGMASALRVSARLTVQLGLARVGLRNIFWKWNYGSSLQISDISQTQCKSGPDWATIVIYFHAEFARDNSISVG